MDEDELDQIKNIERLKGEYRELEEKYLTNLVQGTELEVLRQENSLLRDQLAFFNKNKYYHHVGAEVIGENIDPVGSTLIIDRGSDSGINPGNPVIVGDGIMIGKVLRVNEQTSLVRLLNDSQSRVAAMVMNGEKSIGLVEGGFGISIRMNFIPQNEKLNLGDLIVTSGLEQGILKGLLLGKVEVIEKEAYQPFQKAILSPLVDFSKIDLVSVIVYEDNN